MNTKRIFLVSIALAAALPAFGQSNTPPAAAPPSLPPGFEQATNQTGALAVFNAALNLLPAWDPTQTNSFKSGELTLESAPLWKTMTASGVTPFNSTEADWFFTRNIAAGGELISLGNGAGSSTVDQANIALTLRKDVGNIAGYLIASGGYDFNRGRPAAAFGPGIVYQYQTHVRLFLDTRFEYEPDKTVGKVTDKGSGFLTRIGLQIPF